MQILLKWQQIKHQWVLHWQTPVLRPGAIGVVASSHGAEKTGYWTFEGWTSHWVLAGAADGWLGWPIEQLRRLHKQLPDEDFQCWTSKRKRERELWWLLGQMARQDPKKDLLLGGSIKVDKLKKKQGWILQTAGKSTQTAWGIYRQQCLQWISSSGRKPAFHIMKKENIWCTTIMLWFCLHLSACVIGKTRLFLLLSHFCCTATVCIIHLGVTCVF